MCVNVLMVSEVRRGVSRVNEAEIECDNQEKMVFVELITSGL